MSVVTGINHFHPLPNELQYRVFNFLPEADLLNARLVCNDWSDKVLNARGSECEALAAKRSKLLSAHNFYAGRYVRGRQVASRIPEREVVIAPIKDEPNKIGVISLSDKYRLLGRIYNHTDNTFEAVYPQNIDSSVPFLFRNDYSLEKIFTFSTGASEKLVFPSYDQQELRIINRADGVENNLRMKVPIRDFLVTSQGYLAVAIERHLYIYRLSDLSLIRDIEEDFTAICLSKDQSFLVGYNHRTSTFTTLRFDDPNASPHQVPKWQKAVWVIKTLVSSFFEALGSNPELNQFLARSTIPLVYSTITIGILAFTTISTLAFLIMTIAFLVFSISLGFFIGCQVAITDLAVKGLYLGVRKVAYLI